MTWQAAWKEGRTPWDAGASAPALVALVERGVLPTGRALVPGCGSGYDVLALASKDRHCVGWDLAPEAAKRFDALRAQRGVPAEHAHVEVADFFESTVDEPFDVIFDYTFLCAIEPERRGDWAERMDQLLAPAGVLITLIFPVADKPLNPGGPPHPMSPELVTGLLASRFDNVSMAPVTESNPGREGKEWLALWRRKASAK